MFDLKLNVFVQDLLVGKSLFMFKSQDALARVTTCDTDKCVSDTDTDKSVSDTMSPV